MLNINEVNILKSLLVFSSLFMSIVIYKYKELYNLYFHLESLTNFNNSTVNNLFPYMENNYINNSMQMINISLSLDNSHIYQTLVVMTSVLENNNQNEHYIIFYLLLSHDFDSRNIKIFESLKLKYQLEIKYYYIPNLFNNLRKWKKNSTAIYFKLLIPMLIPNTKRIIHLDGDTLVFKDLWELFNLPFEDNYYLAQPTRKYVFKDRKMNKRVINVGVMLINIEKIRKDNKDFETFYYLFKRRFTEQLAINYVCYPKIGYLPFKYGIFANIHKKNKTYSNYLRMKLNKKVNITEVIESVINPSIVHVLCCRPKHWYKRNRTNDKASYEVCMKFQKYFYYYAKKTYYFKEIYNKFMIYF